MQENAEENEKIKNKNASTEETTPGMNLPETRHLSHVQLQNFIEFKEAVVTTEAFMDTKKWGSKCWKRRRVTNQKMKLMHNSHAINRATEATSVLTRYFGVVRIRSWKCSLF